MPEESTPLEVKPDERSPEEIAQAGKYKYGGIMLLAFAVAVILRWISDNSPFMKFIPALDDNCHGDEKCLGNATVYRISFALFLFFLMHLIMASPLGCCFDDDSKTDAFSGWFIIKLAVFAVTCVISFLLPGGLFTGYAWLCVVLAIVFLIMQAIIIIAFAYDWNDSWTGRSGMTGNSFGEDDSRFARGLLCMTGTFYAFAFVMTGLNYYWFLPSDCHGSKASLHAFLLTFTLVLGVLYSAASIKMQHGSILCSGVIFAYTTWTIFSAIMSGSDDSECNRLHSDGGKVTVTALVQILVAAATLTYTALNTGGSQSAFSMRDDAGGDSRQEKFSYTFFFAAMTVGACYMAMVLTSWTIDKGTEGGTGNPLKVDQSKTSMWAKIGTEWFTIFLYCQTLWAPLVCGQDGCCCRDRDFDF